MVDRAAPNVRRRVLAGPLNSVVTGAHYYINKVQEVPLATYVPSTVESRSKVQGTVFNYYPCRTLGEDRQYDLVTLLIMLKDEELVQDRDIVCGLIFSFFIGVDPGLKNSIKNTLKAHNIDFETMVLTQDDYDECEKGRKDFEDAIEKFDDRHILCVFAVFLLCLAKNVNGENYLPWARSRFRGVCSKMGISEYRSQMEAVIPGVDVIAAFYHKVPSFWQTRKVLLDYLLNLRAKGGQMGDLAKWTLNLLEWAECTHLRTIITELVVKRPDMLSLSEFRSELPFLKGTLSQLASLKDYHPFVKLITDPSAKTPMHSANFKVMSAVSWYLQERVNNPDTENSRTANYHGTKLDADNPYVLSAVEKIQFYDNQLKSTERAQFQDTYGQAAVDRFEVYLDQVRPENNQE